MPLHFKYHRQFSSHKESPATVCRLLTAGCHSNARNRTAEWSLNRAKKAQNLQSDIFNISVRTFESFFPNIHILVHCGCSNGANVENSIGLSKSQQWAVVFYIHGSVHRDSILIRSNEMQQYAGVYLLQNYSTFFGCLSHPSSGVHQTVTAASGTDVVSEQQPSASVA